MVEVVEIQPGFKETEVGVIPIDWNLNKLGDLSDMKSGETITSKTISEFDIYPCYGGNGIRGYNGHHCVGVRNRYYHTKHWCKCEYMYER